MTHDDQVRLLAAVTEAERAARRAHNLAYEVGASLGVRLALGRAQSILMSRLVRMLREVTGRG